MATHQDLVDAIARIRTVTGDPDGWTAGLSGHDIAVALNPISPPAALGGVLAKVVGAHPEVFRSGPPSLPTPLPAPTPALPEAQGVAADAIANADAVLDEQRSAAGQVDLQVIAEVLNAQSSHAGGVAALDRLQRDIEDAVAARTDLDTPAGARAFQQYLIGRLRDIRTVVENAGVDSGSRAALAAALAAVYASSTPEDTGAEQDSSSERDERSDEPAGERDDGPGGGADHGAGPTGAAGDRSVPDLPGWGADPLAGLGTDLGPVPLPDLANPAMGGPGMAGPGMAPPVAGWGGGLPPAAPLGGGMAAPPGAGLPNLSLDPLVTPAGDLRGEREPVSGLGADEASDPPSGEESDAAERAEPGEPDEPGEGDGEAPVDPAAVVELPGGETVTAPSPELAAVITAAVAGVPIPEAFGRQGIEIPAPGTPVPAPVDEQQLLPGDIGMFADRHALALGNGTALLDGQIAPVTSVVAPGFLGWQHPPAPQLDPLPAQPDVPAPQAPTAPS